MTEPRTKQTGHSIEARMAVRTFVFKMVDATKLSPAAYERVVDQVLRALPRTFINDEDTLND